jgi:hypothetical protein
MLYLDMHSTKTSDRVRVGTLEEFVNEFIAEVGSVTLTFSDKKHSAKAKDALIRIFQRKWDARDQ